ncbi:MAG TPA: prepilin-type N-terminal cleavage/methylation domain-containing protein [Planctomycetota bacterium]|nr:prepilin-type N-terminal cleavage/methylation domain-containing protein [Planctomycetota bacterium]
MRHTAGHTLIEILVAVFVLALLAGIVLPSGGVGDDRKLDTVQLEIQDAMDHAQSLAYQTGAAYGVRFNTAHGWFGVVNEVGVAVDDPLSHGDYIVRLADPGQPTNVSIDFASFGSRPLAAFNSKGVLVDMGSVHLRAGETQRWLVCNTATATLTEVPVGTN